MPASNNLLQFFVALRIKMDMLGVVKVGVICVVLFSKATSDRDLGKYLLIWMASPKAE